MTVAATRGLVPMAGGPSARDETGLQLATAVGRPIPSAQKSVPVGIAAPGLGLTV
jgi:hypothetical protein